MTYKIDQSSEVESVDQPEHQDKAHELTEAGRNKIAGIDKAKETDEQKLRKLGDVFETLFRAQMGGTFTYSGERSLAWDASSLYTLVTMPTDKGEKTVLVKVGWGEFGKQTFTGDRYPAFRDTPIDLYCVTQTDSFFADGKLAEQMKSDPIAYLKERSVFHAKSRNLEFAPKVGRKRQPLQSDPKPIPYKEMLRIARNSAIATRTTPEKFADFLASLPDDKKELGCFITKYECISWLSTRELKGANEGQKREQEIKGLVNLLINMGVEKLGIAVGDKKAMQSILDLKSAFNFEKKSF